MAPRALQQVFYRSYPNDCEGAGSPGLEIQACGKEYEARHNQRRDYQKCAMPGAHGGQLERHCEQHAGEYMSRCPSNCRQDIRGIKLARRHLQDAGNQRHKGTHDGREAREKDACRSIAGDEFFAVSNEMRIPAERPGAENLVAKLLAQSERQSITDNCAQARSSNHGFALAFAASALMARISVEPGTKVPTTGMASDKASMKITLCA
jgi:hypothetical protein